MAEKTNGQQGAATPPKASGAPLTKMDAVRRALKDLGRDAKPTQLQGHIKKKYGIDMTTDHISTSKGEILRKEAANAKAPARPAAAVTKAPAAPAVAASKAGIGISLEDIETVKALVGRVGAADLKTLIDLLASR
jgi:hypothetical protein